MIFIHKVSLTIAVAIAYTGVCLRSTRAKSKYRDVAQFGSAPRSGRGGRGFESRHPDLNNNSQFGPLGLK